MKKLIKTSIAVIFVLLCGAFIVYRAMNTSPDENLSPDMQAKEIIESGSCLMCHSHEPELPFYGSFPILGDMVKEDMRLALMEHDFTPLYEALCNNQPVDIVSLNKAEAAIAAGTMPMPKFYLIHWGSSINCTEKDMLLNWATTTRQTMPYFDLLAEEMRNEPICPIPDLIDYNSQKARIGKALYFDPILSADSTVSCATCHDLAKGGTDNLQFSEGIDGKIGGVNAPTVFNSAFNFVQFWDGRAATLALQAAGPPTNPIEMGWATWREIEAAVAAHHLYSQLFKYTVDDNKVDMDLYPNGIKTENITSEMLLYPEGATEANITDAIEHFERTLITPNSPFDRYLKGDKDAISPEAKEGYALFKQYECATCHGGVNMGGQSYEMLGLKDDYFAARGTEILEEDKGRAKQDSAPYYLHRFKTPSLRNIALTAPYFHDGTQLTLNDATIAMLRFQIGVTLSSEEIDLMVAFLNTLTGEYKDKSLTVTE